MVLDPHNFNTDTAFHFNADPDPAFHFKAGPDPDSAPYENDANLRPLAHSLQTSILSVHGPPRLHFEPQKLLYKTMRTHADPDPTP